MVLTLGEASTALTSMLVLKAVIALPESAPLMSTATGEVRSAMVPSPSCPWELYPQVYTSASEVSAIPMR